MIGDLTAMVKQPLNSRTLDPDTAHRVQYVTVIAAEAAVFGPERVAALLRDEQDSLAVHSGRHRMASRSRSWPLQTLLTDQPEVALSGRRHVDHTFLLQPTLGIATTELTGLDAQLRHAPNATLVPIDARGLGSGEQPSLFVGVDLDRLRTLTVASRRRNQLRQTPTRILQRKKASDMSSVSDPPRCGAGPGM